MDHSLTQEEQLVADTAARLFADNFSTERLRAFIADPARFPPDAAALGESGLLGVAAPYAADGADMGAVGAMQIAVAAGNRLVPYPVSDCMIAAALLGEARPDLAREVIAGRCQVVFPADSTSALRSNGGKLYGPIDNLPWGLSAQWTIVEAEIDGAAAHVLVSLEAAGVSRTARKSIDPGCPAAGVVFDGVAVSHDDVLGAAEPKWRRLRLIMASAEMLGASRAALDLAVDYMKVRKQFGQEIGKFQALKHLAADAAVWVENVRVATEHAAWAHDAGDHEATMYATIAKGYASDYARRVVEHSLQAHGAIGFTWEYDLHLYLRRVLRLSASSGTANDHRESIAAMLDGILSEAEA